MTDPSPQPLPLLRAAIDVTPVQGDGRRLFYVRDRLDPDAVTLGLSEQARQLAILLDGERTLAQLRAAFLLRLGAAPPERELAEFVTRLDEANLLDSDGYRERSEHARRAFLRSPERAAVHAGGAYPGSRAELLPFLSALFAHRDGPGGPPTGRGGRFARGLIAPHIDLHRGGPTYAWTYRALAESEPADLYVLLGTCHTPMATPLTATRKAYATPLGRAPVDTHFLATLESAYAGDLYEDELSHRAEHSLEFQAVYLRYLQRVGVGSSALVVPLLCGSLHQWVGPTASPLNSEGVTAALGALRRALEAYPGRVCLIAGADLAHVGPQFGDDSPVRRASLESLARSDDEMLRIICRGDAEGFYRQVMADGDARRSCGLSPIYYLLALLGPSEGRLLKYSQWVDPARNGCVTYAGVIFEE